MNKKTQAEKLNNIGPSVNEIFIQIKNDLGGRLPEEMMFGVVAGFLRGKGFSWEESMFGMKCFIDTIQTFKKPTEEKPTEEKPTGKSLIIEGKDGEIKIKHL